MWLQLLINGLWHGSLIALLAYGVCLYLALSRAYTFVIAIWFVLGGYLAYLCSSLDIPSSLTILVASVACATCHLVLELWLFGPLRSAGRKGVTEFVASLAVYVVAINLLAIAFSYELCFVPNDTKQVWKIGTAVLTQHQAVGLSILLLAFIGLSCGLYLTKYGRLIHAIADNPIQAKLIGLPIDQIRLVVVSVVGCMCGCVGAISFWDVGVTPEAGMQPFLLAAVAAVIGGRSNFLISATAAVLLGCTRELAVGVLPGTWSQSIAFIVLLVALLARSFWNRGSHCST